MNSHERRGYAAACVCAVLTGCVSECWLQGVVVGTIDSYGFFIDDGTGVIACMTASCTRPAMLTVDNVKHIVLQHRSSGHALNTLNETYPSSDSTVPDVGTYVSVRGGVISLFNAKDHKITVRLLVAKWSVVCNANGAGEINWIQTLARSVFYS